MIKLESIFHVYYSGTDYRAEGYFNWEDKSIRILKGTKVKKDIVGSVEKDVHQILGLRKQLKNNKVIVDNEFVEDYVFNELLQATTVISGEYKDIVSLWKLRDGRKLSEILHSQRNIDRFLSFYNEEIVEGLPEIKQAIDEDLKKFQTLFPLEKLKKLSIEDYDLRGSKETLAYMIEHGTDNVFKGFLGNNQNKLFYQEKDQTYDCIEYYKTTYPNESVEDRFTIFRDSLYELVSEFDKNNYIITNPLNANTIKGKLIMLYHPEKLLYFNSKSWFENLFKHFGLEYTNKDSIMLNIEMQEFLEQIGIDVQKDIVETSRKIWNYYFTYVTKTKSKSQEEKVANPFENLFIKDEYIMQIIRVLKRKKAIILKGVPGVGKTYVIRDLIEKSFVNIGEQGIEMIQFHQSYSYEEFIEGLKPQMDSTFAAEKGVFYDIAKRAEDDPENNYFLVIDEINRGNISKIFGELMMLIENDKRDSYSLKLAYSKEELSVPGNLYIIGTMNTADRSLTLIDYALRRRFSHLTITPAYGTVKFSTYLREKMHLTETQMNMINHTMIKINDIIVNTLGEDFQIGHSYFVTSDEIEDFHTWFYDVFTFEIYPLLEEYYFDDPERFRIIKRVVGEINA